MIHKIIFALSFKEYLILIAFSLLVYVFRFYYKYFTRSNKLPGPLPLPFIGNSYLFRRDTKKLFTSLNKKFGDIYEVYLGGQRRIVVTRPEIFEKMLIPSTKSSLFLTRFPNSEGIEELGKTDESGQGLILNHNLKSWKYNRHFFTQAILSPSFSNESVEWVNKLFKELEGYWKSLGNDNNLTKNNSQDDKNEWLLETDLSTWIHRFTNDMIVVLTTGERSYSMASHYNTKSSIKVTRPGTLIDDSERFVQGIGKFLLGGPFFLLLGSFLRHNTPFIKDKVKSILENRDYLYNKVDVIIKNRRKEIEETPVGVELKHDMLTSLITANTERDINDKKTTEGEIFRPMTDEEIRGNLFDAFLGGTDTTANLFCFITYYLCHYPQVKQKMLAEIDMLFPPNEPFNLKHDDLSKLKYCEAIIKEVDRMMPVANLLARYTDGPSEIAGYQWEAGTYFIINLASLHSHKDYWPDPEVFNPDRFYRESEKGSGYLNGGFDNMTSEGKIKHKYSFIMFGGGLRICPGRKLAMTELLSLMVLIFRNYNIELDDMKAPLKTKTAVITVCSELKVKIKPRTSQ